MMTRRSLVFMFVLAGWMVLVPPWLITRSHAEIKVGAYRQPAYVSNAYFSDKMVEQGNALQPTSVVKALQPRAQGVAGYFILDLILTQSGSHHFKVNILDQKTQKVTDMVFAPVNAPEDGTLPLYTAAGGLSGEFFPGLWFFKVYDRVNAGTWSHIGTFAIMMMDPKVEKESTPGNASP